MNALIGNILSVNYYDFVSKDSGQTIKGGKVKFITKTYSEGFNMKGWEILEMPCEYDFALNLTQQDFQLTEPIELIYNIKISKGSAVPHITGVRKVK